MHYLLVANTNLDMKLKTTNEFRYKLERIICSCYFSVIDFISKKNKI